MLSCFFMLPLALIPDNLTKIFKIAHHFKHNKENKFPVMSSMYLSSDRSWEITNCDVHSIHIIV